MFNEGDQTQQEWLFNFASALHFQRLDIYATIQTALNIMAQSVGASQGSIVIFDENGSARYTALLNTFVEPENEHEYWYSLVSRGLLGFVMHGRRVIIVRNVSTDPRWGQAGILSIAQSGSAIGLPINFQGVLVGAVILVHPQIDYFNGYSAHMLERMCEVLGAAVENGLIFETARLSEAVHRQLYEKVETEKSNQARDETMRRDLSAMIYHDLRNPLQNIHTSLSGLNRVLGQTRETGIATDLLELAVRSTHQITRMVKGLLDLERLEGGSAVVSRKPADVQYLIGEAVELVRPIIDESAQLLSFEVEAAIPAVNIDSDMIQRVIINLTENAAKHTPSGGKISISAYLVGEDRVAINITDTGQGIAPHVRDKIFDKFYRIRHHNAPSGFGLGLAFCRLAVEAHGGTIWVESEIGKGSTFAFTLPVEAAHHPVTASAGGNARSK